MWIAISVEFGPGIKVVAPSRSRNSASVSHLRLTTTSSCMMPIWAAGPPNAVKPSLMNKAATSASGDTRQVYRESYAGYDAAVLIGGVGIPTGQLFYSVWQCDVDLFPDNEAVLECIYRVDQDIGQRGEVFQ